MLNVLKNLLLLLISLIISLIIGEFMVRLFSPQQLDSDKNLNKGLYCRDPDLGWSHEKNFEKVLSRGEGASLFKTDENGYRVTSNPANTNRKFLVIGDSHIEGLGLEADSIVPER